MNPHIKSLCILGSVVALGLWNCSDSTSIADVAGQITNGLSQPSISSSSNIIEEESPSSSSIESQIAPTSSSEGSIEVTSSSLDTASISSSSEAMAAESSSEVAKQSSSSQGRIVESSSSVAAQPKSSSSQKPVQSSSSKTVVQSSSSKAQTVKKSVGCGKSLNGIKTGYFKINVNGTNRDYAIDIPNNYDPNKPYRLFYTSHWFGGSAKDVVNGTVSNGGADNWAFFGLKRMANEAGEPAIFIAPSMNGSTWDLAGNGADHALFSSLLNYAKTNLCIDESRVFATGFSFGAMMSYSLSLTHQDEIRAVATLAAANYVGNANSPWVPYPADSKKKIAYLGITGMSDGTCPFIGNKDKKMGGLYAALLHAQDNGCEIPAVPENIDHTNSGSKSHVVYNFKNCAEGYPVRYITFDGGHIAAPTDGQTSDDGKRTWAPKAMWDFFTQF